MGGATCETCLRLRWFLMTAAPLIVGIYLQPGWAVPLAQLVPSPMAIGIAIWVGGAAIFALRLAAHRRSAEG
ncbi:hypothetical protein [Roseovarius aquimarinus]|uniref:Uncharacterized protein n=1 Tax=Roseovarius aquimarinus TaxID=1229156 RepID=A0ABW7I619_9RHOB